MGSHHKSNMELPSVTRHTASDGPAPLHHPVLEGVDGLPKYLVYVQSVMPPVSEVQVRH